MFSVPNPASERAARAALAAFHPPQALAAHLAEHGPEALWERLARTNRRMAGHRHQADLWRAPPSMWIVSPETKPARRSHITVSTTSSVSP